VKIVEKISRFRGCFFIRIIVLVIALIVLWLCIGKVKESMQIIQSHSFDRGNISLTKDLDETETNHGIDDTGSEKIFPGTKPAIESDIGSEGIRMVPPVLIKQVVPEYPEDAQRQGLQGKVVLEAEIDALGRVKSAKLLTSFHPIFVSPTLKAIQQWLYRPMLLNEKPCRCFATITCNFRLTKVRKKIPVIAWRGIL